MTRRHLVVAIPAKDEQSTISDCLLSVRRAVAAARRRLIEATIVVAVDSCSDRTCELAVDGGAQVAIGQWRSPSRARNAAVRLGLDLLDHPDSRGTYVMTTDADTTVPRSWVTGHLDAVDLGFDAVAAGLRLRDCASDSAAVLYRARLRARLRDDGQHVGMYGANLGVRLESLEAVGGFPDVPAGEDRELVRRLRAAGYGVAQPLEPMVTTSGRLTGRAPGGLADLLRGFAQPQRLTAAPSPDRIPTPEGPC